MRKFLALLLLLPTLALAAGPTATLSWTPSTMRTDGTTITGTVTFNLYRGIGTGGEAATPYLTGLTGTTYADITGLVAGTTMCYQMTEVEVATGLESAKTNEACKTFPQMPPATPSALTVK